MGRETISGEACYERFRSGDNSGFDDLMELYRESLIFFLLRYLPSVEDAEDAAEDAFVALLMHPYHSGRGASLKTYLFTLGRNRALNVLRRQKRERALSDLTIPEPSREDYRALEDRLCSTESSRELLSAMDTLPGEYREALYLLYFEGLSVSDTARVMKKTRKQIENLSYRGRSALKEKLSKEILL